MFCIKPFRHGFITSLLTVLFTAITFALPISAQELPITEYPEELLIPPEPPANECGFRYMGYTQTSQAVLQDDPLDQDLLIVRKGITDWRDIYNPAGLLTDFQVPTLEAGIDMVTNRHTFILGAKPYDRQANPDGIGASANFLKINFDYQSSYASYEALYPRVSVFLNGNQISQFLPSTSPVLIRTKGECYPELFQESETVHFDAGLTFNAQSFLFTVPGTYIVRTELVRKAPLAPFTEWAPSGIAVDVIGKVVETTAPKVLLVPMVPAGTPAHERKNFMNSIETYLPFIETSMLDHLPIANLSGSAHLERSPLVVEDGQIADLYDLAQNFLRAKRNSQTGPYDRVIAVVEKTLYRDLLANGNISTHPVFSCFAGYNQTKHFIAVPTLDLSPNGPGPLFGPIYLPPISVVHELFHTLAYKPWAPIPGRMGDCQVAPYHENLTQRGIAFGIHRLGQNLAKMTPYEGARDVMQGQPFTTGTHVSQCSYRRALAELSTGQLDPPVVMVSGTASRSGIFSFSAELSPLYQCDGYYELDENGSGDWHILLKDELGNVLGDYPFEPQFQYGGQLEERVLFNYTLPDLPGLRRVEITGPALTIGGTAQTLLDAIDRTTLAPVIWSLNAQGSSSHLEVNWAGYDFDGDQILYSLLASEDGLYYLPTQVSESTQTTVILDLPPTITHLKLLATDGARSVSKVLQL